MTRYGYLLCENDDLSNPRVPGREIKKKQLQFGKIPGNRVITSLRLLLKPGVSQVPNWGKISSPKANFFDFEYFSMLFFLHFGHDLKRSFPGSFVDWIIFWYKKKIQHNTQDFIIVDF